MRPNGISLLSDSGGWAMRTGRALAFAAFVVLAAVAIAAARPGPAAAGGPARADALVLVNSTSTSYADFQHLVQPYLDNFGVPYSVLDIATTAVPASLGDYSVVIVGHRELDSEGQFLSADEQASIVTAVQQGTGLVSLENDLWSSAGTPLYQFEQSVFGFGAGGATSGSGVSFDVAGTSAGQIDVDCADDSHQQPVLQTTTNSANLSLTDGLWTEFRYTGRSFASVFAGSDEYEQHGLQLIAVLRGRCSERHLQGVRQPVHRRFWAQHAVLLRLLADQSASVLCRHRRGQWRHQPAHRICAAGRHSHEQRLLPLRAGRRPAERDLRSVWLGAHTTGARRFGSIRSYDSLHHRQALLGRDHRHGDDATGRRHLPRDGPCAGGERWPAGTRGVDLRRGARCAMGLVRLDVDLR